MGEVVQMQCLCSIIKYFLCRMGSMKDRVEIEMALPLPLEAFRSESGTNNVPQGYPESNHTCGWCVACTLQSVCMRREH